MALPQEHAPFSQCQAKVHLISRILRRPGATWQLERAARRPFTAATAGPPGATLQAIAGCFMRRRGLSTGQLMAQPIEHGARHASAPRRGPSKAARTQLAPGLLVGRCPWCAPQAVRLCARRIRSARPFAAARRLSLAEGQGDSEGRWRALPALTWSGTY
jgi:hypothetical protein